MAVPIPMSRFELPGHTLPLNWVPKQEDYKGPAIGEGRDLLGTASNPYDVSNGRACLPMTTTRELTMMQIMNTLSDKPGWEEKVFDETISQKWKKDAMNAEGRDVTANMMDWVIDELRWKAEVLKETGIINVYTGDVVKSDTAIPTSLKEALKSAVSKLETIPRRHKDYHPYTDEKVLNLVHPSLFPLVYGVTRILDSQLLTLEDSILNIGNGQTSHRQISDLPYSGKFQWLPSEVDISSPGAKITSYINNLHPEHHKDLYTIIESIIDKAIPLWNRTLGPLSQSDFYCRMKYSVSFVPDPNYPVNAYGELIRNEGESDEAYEDRCSVWENNHRAFTLPEPGSFTPPKLPVFDLRKIYAARGLQIIVKLANIELTPEKPSYDGGSWHVEGAMNEHICATALYYYDNENITDSELDFRMIYNTDDCNDMGYPQDVHGWVQDVFGLDPYSPPMNFLGSVSSKEDRLLTFPNTLQHKVRPFRLADPTKHGHRKIVCLFLVDPGIRIISTANVPPQQRDWWAEVIIDNLTPTQGLSKLSTELKEQIFDSVDDFPISLEEGRKTRLELMEERSLGIETLDAALRDLTFNLCEH